MTTQIFDQLDFYAPWPKFGTNFNQQLGEIRQNQDTLAPLVNGLFVEAESKEGPVRSGDLAGLAFGEQNFRNKIRFFWYKDLDEFHVQCNEGTEQAPIWDTAFYIDCTRDDIVFKKTSIFLEDIQILGTVSTQIHVDDTAGKQFLTNKVTFNRNDFYLEPDSAGKPVVNLTNQSTVTGQNLGSGEGIFAGNITDDLTFKSLVAGTGIGVSSTSSQITIANTGVGADAGAGFYGIVVGNTNEHPVFSGIKVIKFNSDNFYVSQNLDTDTSIINVKDPSRLMLTRLTDLSLTSGAAATTLSWEGVGFQTGTAWWTLSSPTDIVVPAGVSWVRIALGVTYSPTGTPATSSFATTNIRVNGVTPYPSGGLINVRSGFANSAGIGICIPFAYGPIPVVAGDIITVTVAATWAGASAMVVQGGRTYIIVEAA